MCTQGPELNMDLDGDGIMDAVGIDLDGDGAVDIIGVDKDGDGVMDDWECGNECGFSHIDYNTVVEHEKTCTGKVCSALLHVCHYGV